MTLPEAHRQVWTRRARGNARPRCPARLGRWGALPRRSICWSTGMMNAFAGVPSPRSTGRKAAT
jgi:hypothetical protein